MLIRSSHLEEWMELERKEDVSKFRSPEVLEMSPHFRGDGCRGLEQSLIMDGYHL